MMEDFEKYKRLSDAGCDPWDLYLIARSDDLNTASCIRMLREIFNLSLIEAKTIMIQTRNQGLNLADYQKQFVPAIRKILEEYEKK